MQTQSDTMIAYGVERSLLEGSKTLLFNALR
jgi:hypothetical protein